MIKLLNENQFELICETYNFETGRNIIESVMKRFSKLFPNDYSAFSMSHQYKNKLIVQISLSDVPKSKYNEIQQFIENNLESLTKSTPCLKYTFEEDGCIMIPTNKAMDFLEQLNQFQNYAEDQMSKGSYNIIYANIMDLKRNFKKLIQGKNYDY